jgi:hypothetical protein
MIGALKCMLAQTTSISARGACKLRLKSATSGVGAFDRCRILHGHM